MDAGRLAKLVDYRDTLEAARMGGTLQVQWADGSRVSYRSDAELARAIAVIDRELAAGAGGPRPSRIYFSTSKGLT